MDWVTGNIKLNVRGVPVEMEMTVPAEPVKPQRMLPIFQQMANTIVGFSVDAVVEEGKEISCKAGCGACCRQPVPLSETEIYHIAELVENMPEPRRSVIRQRFSEAVEHFRQIGWFERVRELAAKSQASTPGYIRKDILQVALDYFAENVACPFLENEACSIHPDRPLACREYLVTSPAENCAKPTADSIDLVPLMMKPSTTMSHIMRSGNYDGIGMIPLIRALELAEKFPDNYPEKTGPQWTAEFFNDLGKSSGTPNPKPAGPERKTKRRHRRRTR